MFCFADVFDFLRSFIFISFADLLFADLFDLFCGCVGFLADLLFVLLICLLNLTFFLRRCFIFVCGCSDFAYYYYHLFVLRICLDSLRKLSGFVGCFADSLDSLQIF